MPYSFRKLLILYHNSRIKMTSMINLRVFMSERLSSAAIEIFDEVEKVITLYEAEVTRSREEVRYLQKQLELHRLKGS